MSRLESDFKREVGMLVEREWPQLGTTFIFLAANHGEMIGKWALKIFACLGHAAINAAVVKPYMAHDLFAGKLPSDFHVRMGYLRTPSIGTIVSPGLHLIRGSDRHFIKHHDGEAFKAIIALNHLGIGVARAPTAKRSFVSLEGNLPVIAYPDR